MKDEALDLALKALEYIHEGANNQGPHTGISWRCVAVKAEPAIKAIKQALALDKMAENARELGLDYEPYAEELEQPVPRQSGMISITVPAPVAYLCENAVGHKYFRWKKPSSTFKPIALYTTPPAASVLEGRDWSLLEATQESLREHMAELKRLKEAQPAVPDAMTSADIQEHIEYVAGWNDCRQAMLEMMK